MKSISKIAFFVSLVGSFSAESAEQRGVPLVFNEFCHSQEFGVFRKSYPTENPSYFFRAFPEQMKVSFAGDNRNFILDLKDVKNQIQLDGNYDPVPMRELVMTVPNPFRFYSIADILRKGVESPAFLEDKDMKGVYQSVGEMSSSGNSQTYRILTDLNGVSFRDYKLEQTGENFKVTPLTEVKKVCPNADIKLPMVSKDGRWVSGYDAREGNTKIWEIRGEGNCKVIESLRVSAGKADFDYDNQKLVFHLRSATTDGQVMEIGYQAQPITAESINIYVYDLKTKRYTMLTKNFGKSSYYPVFRKDGSVLFADIAETGNASFVHADITKLKSSSIEKENCRSANPADCRNPDYEKNVVLGMLWNQVCLGAKIVSLPVAELTGMNMDPQSCQTGVTNYWTDENRRALLKKVRESRAQDAPDIEKEIERVSAAELMGLCARGYQRWPDPEIVGNADVVQVRTAPQIWATKCMVCHQDIPFRSKEELARIPTMAMGLLESLNPPEGSRIPRMPETGLPSFEIEIMEKYLREVIKIEEDLKAKAKRRTLPGR